MWGYEISIAGRDITADLGYESPCGVMSEYPGRGRGVVGALRIPMWGYESIVLA